MKHITFGENWLFRDRGAFRLPSVMRGPTIREIMIHGSPPYAHEWYVARDSKGELLYEGVLVDEARDALHSNEESRDVIARYPSILGQLLRRYEILEEDRFSVRLLADGTPVVTDERDRSEGCLLFWTGSLPSVGSDEIAETGRCLGRRLMGGSFTFPSHRMRVATGDSQKPCAIQVHLAVVRLQPGEFFPVMGESGVELLIWDGGALHREEVMGRDVRVN